MLKTEFSYSVMVRNTARLYNQLPPLLEQASLSSMGVLANNTSLAPTALASAVSTNPQPLQDTFKPSTSNTAKPLVTPVKQSAIPAINLILTGISMVVAASAVGITLFQGHQYNKRLKELVIPPAEGGVNAALQLGTLLKQAEQTASNVISTVEQALLAQIEALKQTHQQELQTLTTTLEQQKNTLQQHATQTTNTATQALEANIAQLKQQHQQQIEALTLQLNTVSQTHADQLQQKVEALNKQLAGLQQQFTVTEQQLNTATSQQQKDLLESTQQHQAELTTLQQELQQIQITHQNTLNTFTQELAQQQQLATQTAEGLQTQVVQQQEQLSALNATISTLNNQQYQDIFNQQQLERLESRIKELEKVISYHNAILANNNTSLGTLAKVETQNIEIEIQNGTIGYPKNSLLQQTQFQGFAVVKNIFNANNFEDMLNTSVSKEEQIKHPLTRFFESLNGILTGEEQPPAENKNAYNRVRQAAYFKEIYIPTLQDIMFKLHPIENDTIKQRRFEFQLDLALITLALKAYEENGAELTTLNKMLAQRKEEDAIKQWALKIVKTGKDYQNIEPTDLMELYAILKKKAKELVVTEAPIRTQLTGMTLKPNQLINKVPLFFNPTNNR